jgi:hypothetical protein
MGPAESLGDGPTRPGRLIEPAEAAIGVGLQDPAVIGQVLFGMLTAAVARVVEQDGRRPATEGTIIADIGP